VSLTFDDGYGENCDAALPLLARLRVPVTYFVTLGNVLGGKPFDHDVALGKSFRPNTLEELKALAGQGVEIGSHGLTHRSLGGDLDVSTLRDEIAGSKAQIEKAVGVPVRYFAFTFGDRSSLSKAAFTVARQAGYVGACSAYDGYNVPGADTFHLQRHSGTDDCMRLVNWATIDPRKLRIPRFPG
jgi:peptidoglycan/xylan/chitin deacetylase (PgdA/CDA1 family)